MPEIKKRIVIASVLKPLNDTRMTEKIGCSLADNPGSEVHVIGFPSAIPADARISFHTFPFFKRLSLARWFVKFRILRTVLGLQPSILIVTTHELLLTAVVAKIFCRAKLIYDVQENYYLNIRHTQAFAAIARIPIALYVRWKERLMSRFFDHFFLAEKIYASQLSFLKKRSVTLLENKASEIELPDRPRNPMHLVFTGTLSRSTGVFRAINLATRLHAQDRSVRLTIIGFAAIESERKELQDAVAGFPFIELIGIDRLVSHSDIIEALSRAAAGIIAYEVNAATQGRIPTKLFEYLGYRLPVIFIDSQDEWRRLALTSGDFFEFKPSEADILPLLSWLGVLRHRGTFHHAFSWKNEEIKLKTAISAF